MEPNGGHLQYSDTIIRISCLYCYDGDTTVTLGSAREIGLQTPPVFDGQIRTENQKIVVSTAHLDIVLSDDVPTTKTRVRIWENHPSEPDEIVIAHG